MPYQNIIKRRHSLFLNYLLSFWIYIQEHLNYVVCIEYQLEDCQLKFRTYTKWLQSRNKNITWAPLKWNLESSKFMPNMSWHDFFLFFQYICYFGHALWNLNQIFFMTKKTSNYTFERKNSKLSGIEIVQMKVLMCSIFWIETFSKVQWIPLI